MIVTEVDFDIDAIRREWIGRPLGQSLGRYPIEHEPIRRYCHMTGELNPLYLDAEAAAQGPYGRVMCPPALIGCFIDAGPWPPAAREAGPLPDALPRLGQGAINMGTAWEFFAPALVGDRLAAHWSVDDVFLKPTRLDPLSQWVVTVARITNDTGAAVATWRNTVMYHRTPGQPRREA